MDTATPKRTTRTRKNRSNPDSAENAPANGRGIGDDGRGGSEETIISASGSGRESTVEDTDDLISDEQGARRLLTSMGQEFNELSEENVLTAWKKYRKRLMENFGVLCVVMSPKDITELCMKIDENIRGKNPGEGGSPLDAVRQFLGDTVH